MAYGHLSPQSFPTTPISFDRYLVRIDDAVVDDEDHTPRGRDVVGQRGLPNGHVDFVPSIAVSRTFNSTFAWNKKRMPSEAHCDYDQFEKVGWLEFAESSHTGGAGDHALCQTWQTKPTTGMKRA